MPLRRHFLLFAHANELLHLRVGCDGNRAARCDMLNNFSSSRKRRRSLSSWAQKNRLYADFIVPRRGLFPYRDGTCFASHFADLGSLRHAQHLLVLTKETQVSFFLGAKKSALRRFYCAQERTRTSKDCSTSS